MDPKNSITEIEVIKVKPKNVPVVCPVCRNFGTVGFAKKVCHGCQGKGYILVEAEEVERYTKISNMPPSPRYGG